MKSLTIKTKYTLPYDQQLHFGAFIPEEWKFIFMKNLVHSLSKNNSLERKETIQMYFSECMVYTLIGPYFGMVLSNKKEEATNTCTTWMDHMGIILNEKNYLRRLPSSWFCLYNIYYITKLLIWRTDKWLTGVTDKGLGSWGWETYQKA